MRRRGQQKQHQQNKQKKNKLCKNRQIQAQQNLPYNINTIM